MQLYKLHNTNISNDWTSHPDQSRFLNQFQLDQFQLDQSFWPVPIESVPIGPVMLTRFLYQIFWTTSNWTSPDFISSDWTSSIGSILLTSSNRTSPNYTSLIEPVPNRSYLQVQTGLLLIWPVLLNQSQFSTISNLGQVFYNLYYFKISDPHLPNFSTFTQFFTFTLKYPHFIQLNVFF